MSSGLTALKLDYRGQKLSLHDFFFAKSIDALKPGGVLALVTTHFTLDKQNAAIREYLADKADFVGAIRLPSDAFRREGTAVVTDILFLRKRALGEPAHHADPEWLGIAPLAIEGMDIPINRYFLNHPEMVLGTWSHKDTLYGEGYSVIGNGELPQQLKQAIERLPEFGPLQASPVQNDPAPAFTPPPPERHISEGSFFVGDDRTIYQSIGGQGEPVVYGGTTLKADGTLTGKRLAALIGLRDRARRVLQSQNEGWPDANRQEARRELNWAYDRFVGAYGPINKTTFGETADGSVIRRMPNLVKFKEDPDAMLVMSLEDYDEVTGKATKAAIMTRDVVGKTPPITRVRSAEEGLLVSLNQRGAVDLPFIGTLYGKPKAEIVAELGDLIFPDPESRTWQTADAYLSGNVRAKLVAAEAAGPQYARNVNALREVQPEDVLPGDIDANLGAPWIPESDIQAFAADLFHVEPSAIPIAHLKKDAVWSMEADYAAKASVGATSEYGTARANGTWLLDLALNMKTPTIYDTIQNGDREERVINQEATMAAREKQKLIKERFRSWVFSDPDRTERLVRTYNDTYNNLRPRLFDGSHLDFPGMNQTIRLRPHQDDAVWRGMSSGNTLLAHAVGAGKTFTMAATGMKMKQAGLIKKPMFIADEVHNVGAPDLRTALPQNFGFRLGLSATPTRPHDPVGSQAIRAYFGEPVIRYTLRQALQDEVLCQYRYVPVLVRLQDDELDSYLQLTRRIGQLMGTSEAGETSTYLEALLLQRARLLASARGKIPALIERLSPLKETTHNLIYCGDGSVEGEVDASIMRQIDAVVRALGRDVGMAVAKYVADTPLTRRHILRKRFAEGSIQGLIAIRCLDEGVDIPETRRAFILASSTNPRQFIQRRGRILRRAPGKAMADIYDFIVEPSTEELDSSAPIFPTVRKLFRRELGRILEFAGLAVNGPEALQTLLPLRDKLHLLDFGGTDDEGEDLD